MKQSENERTDGRSQDVRQPVEWIISTAAGSEGLVEFIKNANEGDDPDRRQDVLFPVYPALLTFDQTRNLQW